MRSYLPIFKLTIEKKPGPTMVKPITPEQLAASGSEDGHQAALFCWAAQSGIPELKWMFAIPNGGSRHPAEAAKLKATGVKAGVPDIFLAVPSERMYYGQMFYGLFIEMKKPKGGVVSEDQKKWIGHCVDNNYMIVVCNGWEEAKTVILNYLGYSYNEGKMWWERK